MIFSTLEEGELHVYYICVFYFIAAVLAFNDTEYTVNEGVLNVDVCMNLQIIPSGGLDFDLVVPLHTQDGEACKYREQELLHK